MTLKAIVAVYEDWGIGDGETQPVKLKADRVHFREITQEAAVIVGRKTMEDFPNGKPLVGRQNIVITRQRIKIDGAVVVHGTEEAMEYAQRYERCFVIGGASVYEQFFPMLETVYVTKICCCPDSIRFFPNLDEDPGWQCVETGPWQEESGIGYSFLTYRRIRM